MSKSAPKHCFYDIETLQNVFTLCNLHSVSGYADLLDVYILCQDTAIIGEFNEQSAFTAEVNNAIVNRIREKNKNFNGYINFFDLRNPHHALHLINTFGADDSSKFGGKTAPNTFAKLLNYKPFTKDTDADYDESIHPYIFGYNSFNYDSVMLALYFNEVYNQTQSQPLGSVSPAILRQYNDEIFRDYRDNMPDYLKVHGGYASRSCVIRQNMLRSGRHIDIAKLNEKQQKVGLKRILGFMGQQILESDKFMTGQVTVDSLDELADLLAYNVSDVVNLRELFKHKLYKGGFELKKGLLQTYPELVYDQAFELDENDNPIREPVLNPDGTPAVNADGTPAIRTKKLYKPRVAPNNVRFDRLYIDSSSAQLAAKTLCPYGKITDMQGVSFMYPSERQSKELGIPRVNVLEECNKFFCGLYAGKPEPLAKWSRIYRYYKFIEGKNFNSSTHQLETYPGTKTFDSKLDLPKKNTVCDSNYTETDLFMIDGETVLQKSYEPTNLELREKYAGYYIVVEPAATIETPSETLGEKAFDKATGHYMRGGDTNVYDASGNVVNHLIYDATTQKLHCAAYLPTNLKLIDRNICNEDGTPTGYFIFDDNTTLEYYDADGNTTGCYVVFGIGGIHGAEYNKKLYDAQLQEFQALKAVFDECKKQYPDPLMLKQKPQGAPRGWKWSIEVNGQIYDNTFFLKSNSTSKKAEWKDIEKLRPKLFINKKDKGVTLNPKYTRTSADYCTHEDFTSYYPNMLRMMDAFWNDGLGYDRYAEIFFQKEEFGIMMKDPAYSEAERAMFDVKRNGTKLTLNSASGAADAKFSTPIQANNQIMSMRIIGQLFTWRVGQAQSYHGARIISTNTDGLYSVLEPELNNKILADEAANIHVDIQPEPCFLVSKDSNNRLEQNEKGKVYAVAGGSLAAYKEPDLSKSLSHPAIIDRALGDYLRNADNCHAFPDYMERPFDEAVGRKIFENARASMEPVKYLIMMQNIAASSPGSHTFIFGENIHGNSDAPKKIMQHYNRMFYVKTNANLPNTWRIKCAVARAVTPATKLLRRKNNEREIQHNPEALIVLSQYGLNENQIPPGKEAGFKKVSGVSEAWHCHVENRSLFELSDAEVATLIDSLEIENYLTLLRDAFEKNWRNLTGEEAQAKSETDDSETSEENDDE